jgi:uncharacterized protein (DUF433 family)
MSLVIEVKPVPLEIKDGVVRVTGTRVPLDTIVSKYNIGATPEEIAQKFPTVDLTDIYAVITYYLQNKEAVDSYIAEREQRAEQRQREIEAGNPNLVGARERLLARRKNN